MAASPSDFLNIDALAVAVASKIKIESPALKRVFGLDEAAAYCGLTRDSFKKNIVRDRLRKVKWNAKFLGEIGENAQQILTNPDSRESIIASIKELAEELEKG